MIGLPSNLSEGRPLNLLTDSVQELKGHSMAIVLIVPPAEKLIVVSLF
jgi:hypothetical protein